MHEHRAFRAQSERKRKVKVGGSLKKGRPRAEDIMIVIWEGGTR